MTTVVADASIIVIAAVKLDTEGYECRDWLSQILDGDELYIVANHTLLEVLRRCDG